MAGSDKNTLVSRLLIFFIGIPLVAFLILCCSYRQHLLVNVLLVGINLMATLELRTILGKKLEVPSLFETSLFATIIPFAMVLHISFGMGTELFFLLALAAIAYFLFKGILGNNFSRNYLERLSSSILLIIYPGMFSIWIMKIAALPSASIVLLVYLLGVFANDSLAWLTGVLFGKGNRGFFPVSPNKSIAGFAGGLSASIGIYMLAATILPLFDIQVFSSDRLHSLLAALFMGLATGLATITGDLVESALKRASEVKDSGTIMQGRGGMLDSIDSIIFVAPVFWYLYTVLYT